MKKYQQAVFVIVLNAKSQNLQVIQNFSSEFGLILIQKSQ